MASSLADLNIYTGRQFIEAADAGQRDRTLADLGRMASAGDYKGAEAAAWKGGQPEWASKLHAMNADEQARLVEDAASWAYGADTPQAWEAGRQAWAQRGFDVGPFQARNAIVARGMSLKDQLDERYRQQQLAIERERLAKSGQGGDGIFGTPILGQDENGNTVVMALGKNGQLVRAAGPDGVKVMGPFDRASETAAGKTQGTNAGNLPNALAAGDRIVRGVDDLLSDPGLSRLTGPVQSWLPNVSGDANRAQSRLDQIQGGTFLQAYNDLRGGGQITEKEGEKATAAYNRLSSTGMSDADYRNALAEFKAEVLKLMDIARQRAGQGGFQPPQSPAAGDGGNADDIDSLIQKYAP